MVVTDAMVVSEKCCNRQERGRGVEVQSMNNRAMARKTAQGICNMVDYVENSKGM